jgi:spermidine synthase
VANASERATAPPPAGPSPAVVLTGAAILLSGFCAMGVELLWFRQFSIVLGSHRAVFSLLLTVILAGIWLGALAGGACQRRFGRPVLLYMITQTAFVVLTIVLLAYVAIERVGVATASDLYSASFRHRFLVSAGILQQLLVHVGLPAFLMGFAYPLANANIQDALGHVGRRAGLLYVANSLGAVLGALVTGFVLVPRLGFTGSLTVLAVVGALAVVALAAASGLGRNGYRRLAPGAACLAALGVVIALWLRVPDDRFRRVGLRPDEAVLDISEGVNELIAVTEMAGGAGRRLNTNGHSMSGNGAEAQRYMRAFAHLPLLHLEHPTDVLVICFGVGTTLHAASLHPSVERLELADLSRHVVEHAGYFAGSNHGVLADPRTRVFINDGRQHLRMRAEGSYDLITLEPPPIAFAGVSALYSREFYQLARSRLKDGGYMSQWLPAYQLPAEVVLSMVRAFLDVFPNAIILAGERGELILLGANAAGFTIDLEALERRLAQRPAVAADLARVHLGTPTEIIGTFFSSSATLVDATAGVEPVTDDHPIMEYAGSAASCWRTRFPAALIETQSFPTWCPTCVKDGRLAAPLATLGQYLHVLDAYYRSSDFLDHTSCGIQTPTFVPPLPPDSAVFHATRYFAAIFGRKYLR